MRTLMRAELDKLTTLRSTWIVLAAGVVIAPGIAAVVLATSVALRGAVSQIGADAFGLSGVAAGMLCAVAFASEYQDRTIATTFALVPARRRVVVAKAVAAAIVGALVAVIVVVMTYGLAAIWLAGAGVGFPMGAGALLRRLRAARRRCRDRCRRSRDRRASRRARPSPAR